MNRFEIKIEEEAEKVPFATWDPDDGEGRGTKYPKYAAPMKVTLEEGDMLYLPALWPVFHLTSGAKLTQTRYHKVSQSCSEEGICVAVNYWFDMEFSGSFYPLCNFARSVGNAALT